MPLGSRSYIVAANFVTTIYNRWQRLSTMEPFGLIPFSNSCSLVSIGAAESWAREPLGVWAIAPWGDGHLCPWTPY